MGIYNSAWALLLLPLLGVGISMLAETPRRAAQACVVSSVLAVLMAAVILGARLTHPLQPPFEGLLTFFAMSPPEGTLFVSRLEPQLGVLIDSLSASFAFALTVVLALVQSYALTSLRGDPGYRRFFWASSLLGFAALGFVLSPNLFDSLFLWVIGSAAVYLLAAHWWDRQDAAAPARRTLVALHVADIALLLATVIVLVKFGVYSSQIPAPAGQSIADPFGFDQLTGYAAAVLHGAVGGAGLRTLAVMASVLIFAAVFRAAQVPFHVWLTETSTSPVPVVALILALATSAGVYLLARVYPLLLAPLHAISALALVGAATAVVAAGVCLAQRDILRIAVLSAVAQLGLVVAALGTGGYGQGLFVLFTTLLFSTLFVLGAGNLVRVYRTRSIHEMGGAWGRMGTTRLALVVWAAGIAGLSLNTYYALSSAFENAKPSGPAVGAVMRVVVALLVVVAAVLMAAYAWRVVWHVCAGEVARRRGFQPERVVEVDPPMARFTRYALGAAILAVIVGLPGIGPVHAGRFSIPGLTFTRFVYEYARPALPMDGLALVIALAAGAIGAGAAWLLFAPQRRAASTAIGERFPQVVHFVSRDFNLERAAHRIGRPVLVAASFVSRLDDTLLESIGSTVTQSAEAAAALASRARAARSSLYLAGGFAIVSVLALLSVLAATGHFWIHSI